MATVSSIQHDLRGLADPKKAASLSRFFKTRPGEYAEGDQFLGITVPNVRKVAKRFRDIPLNEVEELLHSHWHEERLLALIILVSKYRHGTELQRSRIYELYMSSTLFINNWDLVDSSAAFIVGPQLEDSPYKLKVLRKLAASDSLWERRIAMLATFDYIKKGRADEALMVAEQLLHDKHDLIQKAVGWMLREIEKRVDVNVTLAFLDKHAATMPRTTLRYAIEHLSPEQTLHYMGLAKRVQ